MDERVMGLLDKLGLLPKGSAEQGAIFNALPDEARSAVTQVTRGDAKQMPGLQKQMSALQKKMSPEAYRALMEDQIMVNSSPLAQIMNSLGLHKPQGR